MHNTNIYDVCNSQVLRLQNQLQSKLCFKNPGLFVSGEKKLLSGAVCSYWELVWLKELQLVPGGLSFYFDLNCCETSL
jgi:hypothetical protein